MQFENSVNCGKCNNKTVYSESSGYNIITLHCTVSPSPIIYFLGWSWKSTEMTSFCMFSGKYAKRNQNELKFGTTVHLSLVQSYSSFYEYSRRYVRLNEQTSVLLTALSPLIHRKELSWSCDGEKLAKKEVALCFSGMVFQLIN